MTAWAIIPVKHLSGAKSSFSEVFTQEQRKKFVLCMLADVLNVLRGALAKVLVVSPDEEVLNFAGAHAESLREHGLGLNGALELAIRHAVNAGATEVLILPADLPLLKASDIGNIVAMASSPKEVVIAPSKANGTNALLLRPPNVIDLRFGGESFPLHVKEASQAGVKPRIYRSPTIATDIDEVTDLLSVETWGLGTRTYEFLHSLA